MTLATIIIPTRNRVNFLRRVLAYLEKANTEALPIVVSDSSDQTYHEELFALINDYSKKLPLNFIHFPPELDFGRKISCSLKWVNTPCAVINADDDFLVPATVRACAEFLCNNPDYALAHGHSMLCSLAMRTDSAERKITNLVEYAQVSREEPDALERLQAHARCYCTTFYSTYRLDLLKRLWPADYAGDKEFSEILPSFLAHCLGKAKKLDHFYMLRQVHGASDAKTLCDPLHWISSPEFSAQFLRMKRLLAESLPELHGKTLADREEAVHRAIYLYFAEYLAWGGGAELSAAALTGQRTYKGPGSLRDSRLEAQSLLTGTSPFSKEVKFILDYLCNGSFKTA